MGQGRMFIKSATNFDPFTLTLHLQPPGNTQVIERPDPSLLLATKSDWIQRLGVIAIAVALAGGTSACVSVFHTLRDILPDGSFDTAKDIALPIPLGLLFTFVGITHFVYRDDYAAIVPPRGTWGGLWNIPAPGANSLGLSYQQYHALWTGVAEVGGGLLLILAGLDQLPMPIPAFLLFLLTVAVTPANIYMFTHDAPLSFAPPVPYPSGHIVRGILQCVLLSCFWILAFS